MGTSRRRPATTATLVSIGVLLALAVAPGRAAAASPEPVPLGAAESFAVLGATTVTNTGASTVNGDLGVSPGTAVTGFGAPPAVNGSVHTGSNGPAGQAQADSASAYADAVGRSPTAPAGVLDGLTLTPGVYGGPSLGLAGTLTLDADGDPNAVFILKSGSTLTTAANSQVALVDGAQACNVFWQVGSSATLGETSSLKGSILAHTSITIGAGVAIDGRALALNGAVTMDTDTVTTAHCAAGSLSNTAPDIAQFSATITGVTQTVHTAVGAWTVSDTRGSDDGYIVTVSATAPTVGGSAAAAGTGARVRLTPKDATPASGNPATSGPLAVADPVLLTPAAATIAIAGPGSGQGTWLFPGDAGAQKSLAIVIPGDAAKGAYSSTLTFTTAPPA